MTGACPPNTVTGHRGGGTSHNALQLVHEGYSCVALLAGRGWRTARGNSMSAAPPHMHSDLSPAGAHMVFSVGRSLGRVTLGLGGGHAVCVRALRRHTHVACVQSRCNVSGMPQPRCALAWRAAVGVRWSGLVQCVWRGAASVAGVGVGVILRVVGGGGGGGCRPPHRLVARLLGAQRRHTRWHGPLAVRSAVGCVRRPLAAPCLSCPHPPTPTLLYPAAPRPHSAAARAASAAPATWGGEHSRQRAGAAPGAWHLPAE